VSYIDRNLIDGEHIVFRSRVHWLLYLWPLAFAAFLFLPSAWLLATAEAGRWRALSWIPLAVAALAWLGALIRRRSSDFAVTDRRVMMKVGLLHTRSVELLLGKVEAIAVNQTLAGRLLGYGDIVITGSGGTREPFYRIQAPLEFRRAVQAAADARPGGADAERPARP
jgi:uncharacterized membrane protein YdbT with pleckstrin-like domain